MDGRYARHPSGQPPVEARALAVRVNHVSAELANQPQRAPERQRRAAERVEVDRSERDAEHAKVLTIATIPGAADAHAELVARKTANEVIDLPWPAAERGRGEKLEDADQPAARSIVAVIDAARLGLQWPFEPL